MHLPQPRLIYTYLTFFAQELESTAATVRSALQSELANSDALLAEATTLQADLSAASVGLSDADAVAHADALIARSAGFRATAAALPSRPVTAACVSLTLGAEDADESALLHRIAAAGSSPARLMRQRGA